jgi:LacI family transcriptional regulator
MGKEEQNIMAVRMKDIAQELGVSVVTVSKALRSHSDISLETRTRILRKAKELNYRPDLGARALVTGRTAMMGLVVPSLVHPFFSYLARGLSGTLRKRGYTLVISSSEEDGKIERQHIEQLMARRVDALLVASIQRSTEIFRRVEKSGIPYILIDRSFDGLAANFVGVNDEQVGIIATEHLLEAGRKTIAHIGHAGMSSTLGRHHGYQKALARHGADPGPAYIVNRIESDPTSEAAGFRAARKLLKLKPRPDGIFSYNDSVAIGAMKAIIDTGLRVPEDVALVGCGNYHFDDFLRVSLTSVDQQNMLLGQRAAALAISLVESKRLVASTTILLEPKLVVRQSSAKVPRGARGAR